MRKPINGELIYTGGGIYVGIGQTDDGNWYLADHGFDAVRILNADINLAGDDAWYPEWQEKHLVYDYQDGEDSAEFLYESLKVTDDLDCQHLMNLLEENYPRIFDKNINLPMKIKYRCPRCDYEMLKAPRCPECGQLIEY